MCLSQPRQGSGHATPGLWQPRQQPEACALCVGRQILIFSAVRHSGCHHRFKCSCDAVQKRFHGWPQRFHCSKVNHSIMDPQ